MEQQDALNGPHTAVMRRLIVRNAGLTPGPLSTAQLADRPQTRSLHSPRNHASMHALQANTRLNGSDLTLPTSQLPDHAAPEDAGLQSQPDDSERPKAGRQTRSSMRLSSPLEQPQEAAADLAEPRPLAESAQPFSSPTRRPRSRLASQRPHEPMPWREMSPDQPSRSGADPHDSGAGPHGTLASIHSHDQPEPAPSMRSAEDREPAQAESLDRDIPSEGGPVDAAHQRLDGSEADHPAATQEAGLPADGEQFTEGKADHHRRRKGNHRPVKGLHSTAPMAAHGKGKHRKRRCLNDPNLGSHPEQASAQPSLGSQQAEGLDDPNLGSHQEQASAQPSFACQHAEGLNDPSLGSHQEQASAQLSLGSQQAEQHARDAAHKNEAEAAGNHTDSLQTVDSHLQSDGVDSIGLQPSQQEESWATANAPECAQPRQKSLKVRLKLPNRPQPSATATESTELATAAAAAVSAQEAASNHQSLADDGPFVSEVTQGNPAQDGPCRSGHGTVANEVHEDLPVPVAKRKGKRKKGQQRAQDANVGCEAHAKASTNGQSTQQPDSSQQAEHKCLGIVEDEPDHNAGQEAMPSEGPRPGRSQEQQPECGCPGSREARRLCEGLELSQILPTVSPDGDTGPRWQTRSAAQVDKSSSKSASPRKGTKRTREQHEVAAPARNTRSKAR